MGRSARRGFNKLVKRCPHCGARGPKEFVEGPPRVNWVAFVLLLVFTGGLGLVAVPLWYGRHLEAYCDDCDETFPP